VEALRRKRGGIAVFAALVALAISISLLIPRVADAKETVVVRGDRSTIAIDDAKLESLIHLELGEKSALIELVVIELGAKSVATVVVARRDGSVTKGAIDLSGARGAGDVDRTIALFVGELSREEKPSPSASASPAPAPAAAPTTTDTTTDAPATPKARDTSNGARLVVGGTGRVVGIGRTGGNAVVFGPTLGVSLGIGDRARIGALGRVGFASANDRIGKVSALLVGGGIDAAYRLYVSADRSMKIDTGPRVVASWIHGEGIAAAPAAGGGGGASSQQVITTRESSALGIDLAWFIDASVILARPFFLGLAMEGGWLTPGLDLRADNRKILQVSGASLGATLSIGVDFEPR
jgi:hypothetical protein